MSTEPQLAWDVQADLGEGPVWVERDRALWFTDIKSRKIYRFEPGTDQHREWDAPERVGFVLKQDDKAGALARHVIYHTFAYAA